MGIGAYRHLVTLDPPGGQVVDPPTWYCALQSAATQVVDGLAAFYVRGRAHPGLTLETQLHFEGRTFQVQSISDLDERHREVQLLCVEVVGRGHAPAPAVGVAPTITTQPMGVNVTPGGGATLTVVVTGTPPLAYQWTKNLVDIPGAVNPTYATGPLSTAATYAVRVSNPWGTVTSAPALVAVGTAPVITTQPQSSSVASGASVTLTVVATGTAPLAYQWTKAGVPIAGATNTSYITGPLSATASYAVTVSNGFGTVTSTAATVTVLSTLVAGLVSYWAFDTGWNDLVGPNHLTNVNGVTSAPGKLGNAADFERDSAQALTFIEASPLGNEDFTYTFWFKRESVALNMVPLGKNNDIVSQMSYALLLSDDGRLFFIFGNFAAQAYTPQIYNETTWHFVVAWHDATTDTVNLQVDNGTVNSGPTGGAGPSVSTQPVAIGTTNYAGSQAYFDGLIDDVALWRRVLTPAERTQLWNAGNGLAYPFA